MSGWNEGTAVPWPVDHVDDVAVLNEVGSPPRTPVRGAKPVGALAAAAVDQHHRLGMAGVFRRLPLYVHRAPGHGPEGTPHPLGTDPEESPAGGDERTGGLVTGHGRALL